MESEHFVEENVNVLMEIIFLTGYHYGVTSCEGCKVSLKKNIKMNRSIRCDLWKVSVADYE